MSRNLQLLLDGGSVAGLGDRALLARVAAGPGLIADSAFAGLIARHGALVARVCTGILGDVQLAEDAAQAVFLVLLRRAGSIRDPDQLAAWLYGVALRTARVARRRQPFDHHPLIPSGASTMIDPRPDPTQTSIHREQAEILYQAIARLPRRYLAPVVLCDLDGLTHAEAAAQLGCPVATVSGRIKRAKEKLRSTLARHRLDFESVLPPVAVASVPRTLAATASAQILASRVLWLTATKWKAALVAGLVAGFAAAGAEPKPGLVAGPPAVEVGLPILHNVPDVVELVGRTTPAWTVAIRPQVSGVLLQAAPALGSLVQPGQLLFKIDDRPFAARVAAQTARLQQAEARLQALLSPTEPGAPGASAAKVAADRAEAELEQQLAQAAQEFAERDLAASAVVAPVAGFISGRDAVPGNRYEPADVMATISGLDPMHAEFSVLPSDFVKLQAWFRSQPETTHLPVRIRTSFLGSICFGRVSLQGSRFDPPTNTHRLNAELLNPNRVLKPNTLVETRVEYGDLHPALLVPETAITRDGNESFVAVVDDGGLAQRRLIRVGAGFAGGLREVTQGIDARTRITLDGTTPLPPGTVVGKPALIVPQ